MPTWSFITTSVISTPIFQQVFKRSNLVKFQNWYSGLYHLIHSFTLRYYLCPTTIQFLTLRRIRERLSSSQSRMNYSEPDTWLFVFRPKTVRFRSTGFYRILNVYYGDSLWRPLQFDNGDLGWLRIKQSWLMHKFWIDYPWPFYVTRHLFQLCFKWIAKYF